MICRECGCPLFFGSNCREKGINSGRYICTECDDERRRKLSLSQVERETHRKKMHYEKNKKTYIERSNAYRKNHINDEKYLISRRISEYKSQAKSRNMNFDLTKEQFKNLVKQPCLYCNNIYVLNGIDRLDNTKGYTLDNSVPCCKRCNVMKNNMTLNEFKNHIKKICEGDLFGL